MTAEPILLLVEDNPRDEKFTLRTLKRSNVCKEMKHEDGSHPIV